MQAGDKYYWQSTTGWRLVELCDEPRLQVRDFGNGIVSTTVVRVRDVADGCYHTLSTDELTEIPAPGVLDNVK